MWLRKFTVRGTWGFPLDMLRYDGCWPSSGEDVAAIHQSIKGEDNPREPKEVTLSTLARTKEQAMRYPTTDRWASFGWRVVRTETPYNFG